MTMDDEHAARLATEHLVELGHRRIGFISGSDEYSLSQWRVDGWSAAMAAAGLATARPARRRAISASRRAKRAARDLLGLAEPPTAIIASNDQMALATLEVARDLGLSRAGRSVDDQLRRYADRALRGPGR